MRKLTSTLGATSILGALAAAATLAFLPAAAHGQVTLSATGGVTFASMYVKATEPVGRNASRVLPRDVSGLRRYSAGLTLAVPVADRYLFRVDGGYAQRGVKIGLPLDDVSGLQMPTEWPGLGLVSLATGHVELASLFGVRIPGGESSVYLLAGPSLAYQVQCSADVQVVMNGFPLNIAPDCSNRDFDMMHRDFDAGAVGVAGFEVGLGSLALSVEGRYYLGLTDIADGLEDVMRHRGTSVRAGVGIPIG